MELFMKFVLLALLVGFSSHSVASGAQQRLSVKGSVVNEAKFGSTSEMEMATSRGVGKQTVQVKGSVVNQSSGRNTKSRVSVGAN
jgi:hypothetical protein